MLRVITILNLVVMLAGCASGPTAYQKAEENRYGYAEQAIESDRYRITFRGNSLTGRDKVEIFVLFRAAELTLEKGYDHFRVVQRDIEADRRLVDMGGYDRARLHYRYYHPGYGWYGWRDPLWNDVDVREVTRYEASGEIVLGRGSAPDTPDAFEACEVIQHLWLLVTGSAPQ